MRELAASEIGARIAQARQESGGMTQDELADLLGVTMRSVQNYESGATVPWRHFERLEDVFKRPLTWFLHGADGERPISPDQAQALLARVEEVHAEVREVRQLLESLLADLPQESKGRSRSH